MSDDPTANGANGRDSRGRFATGNAGGPGNPHVRKTAKLRAALLAAVSEDDIASAVAKLRDKALEGDIAAIRELLDRVLGKPSTSDLAERVERLEQLLEARYA